ncbi:Putative AMP-dependent synthetase/ligase, phosphopantetheine binding ACP domain, AMP-binding protein [Septoria linicola]|uniref:AMP-dependent synthetase/ligase, phosphopantetheine binding ACP domain, AMP-binding protein n=1 Tax=Septoria linicola TaxID=215465 RepID=A0A9Q9AHQ4_9PEZI|nr:putative AMP-dependent synthetase/ligase, phosphopantetheine binding ACP domain, AMP-binding protein [Septoria linicola]USW47108.1 Putative AMP-dependent synthetase/ligase, phosphopantetheine binding ACP domain, AMP-binding protein [Septoria linicola]
METLLARLADDHADRAALIESGHVETTISYASVLSEVEQLRKDLAHQGVSDGSVVALAFPNSLELALTFLALLTLGATVAPLNPKFKADDEISGADGAFATATDGVNCMRLQCERTEGHFRVSAGNSTADTRKDSQARSNYGDVALILHTSGTTGKPKRVPLTLDNLLASTQNVIGAYKLGEADRTQLLMPLFHIHGIVAGFLAPLICGAGVVIPMKGLSDDFWRAFVDHEATWWTATPTHQKMILDLPPPAAGTKLRFIRSCSSALSPQDLNRLEERFQVPVLQAYAMTENAHHIASHVIDRQRTLGSVGYPAPTVDVVIVDENGVALGNGQTGEIAIKGKSTMLGYLGNAEANEKSFTSSGHFRTGDIGSFDEAGCLSLTGRSKEMINKGGESMSPVEIDNVLSTHEDVAEAVSFAIPDEVYGEDIGVALVLVEGKSLTEAELISWLKDKVSETKLPKIVWFVDAIPKTSTGKLQRLSVAKSMLDQDSKERGHVPQGSGGALEDLRQIWSEVLRVHSEDIKDGDSFAALSGDSGLAVRLVGAARSKGYTLNVAQIFTYDDLKNMADQMETLSPDDKSRNEDTLATDSRLRDLCAAALSMPIASIEDAYPITLFQSHMAAENLESGTWVATYIFRCQAALLPPLKDIMALIQHRHAVLRAHTVRIDGRFYQAVARDMAAWEDISCVETYLAQMRGRALSLGNRALRIGHSVEDDEALVILILGHVIMDEWTRSLLFEELETGLRSFEELQEYSTPSPSFGSFARWIDSLGTCSLSANLNDHTHFPYDIESMKTIQTAVELDDDLLSKYPWSVYAHLAWALAVAKALHNRELQSILYTMDGSPQSKALNGC